jgi:hypothetical protein
LAQGYLYYVSLKGVTGSAALNVAEVAEKLAMIRACTDLPLGVGFGIKDPPTAAAVARIADAVVVGSALVAKMARTGRRPRTDAHGRSPRSSPPCARPWIKPACPPLSPAERPSHAIFLLSRPARCHPDHRPPESLPKPRNPLHELV